MLELETRPASQFTAILVGFDVEGFSRTVEKAALQFGRAAGELAAQRILAGERVVTALAGREGLRFADALGDGAVYLRAQAAPSARESRDLARLLEELKYSHLKQTGLSIRTAWTHGQVRITRPAAPILEHGELLWGPAVAQLHQGLQRRSRTWRRPRDSLPERPDLGSAEGEIADLTFVYMRLCGSADWSDIDEGRLNDALDLIARWAERLGGRLERITQDEKGLHVRVGVPAVDAIDPDWERALREPQQALRRLGLDGAVAAARGPVYRGPSEHGSTIVHGGAVNRAAKLCAGQPPGGLAVDASLAIDLGPIPAVKSHTIGRQEEQERILAWLAGGGPRMVAIRGEAGIGKSHLLRSVFAPGAPHSAFVGGALGRMLDPMGAWFELLDQLIPVQAPELRRVWALNSFQHSGLDPAMLPLFARVLPGLEPVNEPILQLTGRERAARTAAGVLALVDSLAQDGPLLIGIDDLHELDEASLGVTLAILERGLPVQIISASRPVLDGRRLADLLGHLSTLDLPLSPLSAEEVGALVTSLGQNSATENEVMAISAGNPFEAVQAAMALAEDGIADAERTLSAILDRRLNRLDMDDREVLRALAITDRSWRIADLDSITPVETRERPTAESLKRLADARFIERAPNDRFGFQISHRLLTEAVRRRTPAGVGRRMSVRAARRLTRIAAWGRRSTGAETAGLWASAGSRGRAAVIYERAARVAATEGADSACAQLMSLTLRLFDGAAPTRLPRRAVRWFAELARAEWSLGLVQSANLAARRSVTLARGKTLPRHLRDSAVAASALRAETGQFLGELGEILLGSLEAGRLGGASADRAGAQGRGLSSIGYLLGLTRLSGPADRFLRRGELMATAEDPRPAAFALTARAILHFVFARWAEGEFALAKARSICADWPHHQLLEVIETTCGLGAHLQGDGVRALSHFDALAKRARERGSDLHAGWADYASAQTLLALDRPHEGWERLGAAEERLKDATDRQSQHICLGLRARLAWALGDIDEALATASQCGRASRALAPTNYSSTEAFSAPALIGALSLTSPTSIGQRTLGRRLVREHLRDIERYAMVFPIARPRSALIKALIKSAGNPEVAIARLDASVAMADQMGLGFDAMLAARIGAQLDTRPGHVWRP